MTQLEKARVKSGFALAAAKYQSAAVVQAEIVERLVEKLAFLQLQPEVVLDLGCGPGNMLSPLRRVLPAGRYIGVDFAYPMLAEAKKYRPQADCDWLCADIEQLPISKNCCDLILSASTFQWCERLADVFARCWQVLREEGTFLFTTFGPDTLQELRFCFEQVDSAQRHVNSFVDMHTLGDMLVSAGFVHTVMEVDRLQVSYRDPWQLLHDLRATGAKNHLLARSRGLYSPAKLKRVIREYHNLQLDTGQYPATYEVIYGLARKPKSEEADGKTSGSEAPLHFYP